MLFDLWSLSDAVVWFFLVLHPIIIFLDIKYELSKRVVSFAGNALNRVDLMFCFFLLLLVLFFYLDGVFKHVSQFFSIVDYSDERYAILRWDIISAMVISYMVASILSVCWWVYAKVTAKGVRYRYLLYLMIYNVLAVLYIVIVDSAKAKKKLG